jgi:pSer/pThr/pTyr-binding forkhead associated (FHA) protein
MAVKLLVIQGNTRVQEVQLRRPRTVAGRKKGCKLRIRSELVSRIHCTFICSGSHVSIKDLGSSNGTFVNGLRIAGETPLNAGDVVQVGPVKFAVKIIEDVPVGSGKGPRGASQRPVDDVVFFESDDTPEDSTEPAMEAELLEEIDDDEIVFETDDGPPQSNTGGDDLFAAEDRRPLDVDQFLVPEDEHRDDFGLAKDSSEQKRKRRT